MCTCVKQVNELLGDQNSMVVTAIYLFNPERSGQVYVETRKINPQKRGKAARLLASYCPFCGEKYPAAKTEV